MLNHIVIMGRLTRDPELRRTGSGIAVASFTLAVDRDFAPKDGGERETDFIDCVAWRQTGEFVSKYFAKGRMAVVSGSRSATGRTRTAASAAARRSLRTTSTLATANGTALREPQREPYPRTLTQTFPRCLPRSWTSWRMIPSCRSD